MCIFYIIEFNDTMEGRKLAGELTGFPNGTVIQFGQYIHIKHLREISNGLIRIIRFADEYKNHDYFNWFADYCRDRIIRFEKINIYKSIHDAYWIWDDDYLFHIFRVHFYNYHTQI